MEGGITRGVFNYDALKNITAGNPKTKEQYQLTKQFNIKWLYSDDGKNWYEEQKNFQPDTLKMVYDRNGVIICIEKDVSAINPVRRKRR
ncbi:putative tail fiber assembly protein [Escherichia coli Jurua 20/10]|nr:putative tail fiber assembly protein [Escherichia coli Jurua 20/10]